jgi:hypothetical protein
MDNHFWAGFLAPLFWLLILSVLLWLVRRFAPDLEKTLFGPIGQALKSLIPRRPKDPPSA